MPTIQAKQITKLLAGWVPLNNQTVSSSSTLVITSPLTTALATAGNNSTSVPLNANGSSSVEGVITGSTAVVPVYAYPSGAPISVAGAEVYGILTQSGGVYTVTFYTLVSGTQTATSLNQAVNLSIPYSFTFNDLPYVALLQQADSNPGSGISGSKVYQDNGITVTGTNTISNLTKSPADPNSVTIFVNGQALGAGNSFTVSGQAISISSGQISFNGFNITTTDNVYALYSV